MNTKNGQNNKTFFKTTIRTKLTSILDTLFLKIFFKKALHKQFYTFKYIISPISPYFLTHFFFSSSSFSLYFTHLCIIAFKFCFQTMKNLNTVKLHDLKNKICFELYLEITNNKQFYFLVTSHRRIFCVYFAFSRIFK